MKYHIATTRPINPSSAPSVLTRAQVWAGLRIKSRDPAKFVPAIATCEVLREDHTGLTRVVTFKPGTGPPGKVTELVTFADEVKADFYMPDSGTAISNIISVGEDETDLYLTFTFSWNFPEIVEGTEEAATQAKTLEGMARKVVPHTIEEIRAMVKDGTIA